MALYMILDLGANHSIGQAGLYVVQIFVVSVRPQHRDLAWMVLAGQPVDGAGKDAATRQAQRQAVHLSQ